MKMGKKVLIFVLLIWCITCFISVTFAEADNGNNQASDNSYYRICGYITPNCNFNSDSGKDLLTGYNVELIGTDKNAITDKNGYFEIGNIINGTYTLKITKKGCLPKIIQNVVVKDEDTYISKKSEPEESYLGDVNSDNTINLADMVEIAKVFNSKIGDDNYDTMFDLNADGVVNIGDVIVLAVNFNKVGDKDSLSTPTPIPTPTTKTNDYAVRIGGTTITRNYVYTPSAGFEKIDKYGPGELGYYLIVFSGPLSESMKNEVEMAGAKLYSSFQGNGNLATIITEDIEKVKSLDYVLDVVIFQNEYKVTDRSLLDDYTGEVIVVFYDSSNSIYDLAKKIGGVKVKSVYNSEGTHFAVIQIDNEKVNELCKFPQIQYIQKNYVYTIG